MAGRQWRLPHPFHPHWPVCPTSTKIREPARIAKMVGREDLQVPQS